MDGWMNTSAKQRDTNRYKYEPTMGYKHTDKNHQSVDGWMNTSAKPPTDHADS